MSVITAEEIKQVCDGIWRGRGAVLTARGALSGEDALAAAAYWRLCSAGLRPGESIADCAPFLRELVRRYRAETARVG